MRDQEPDAQPHYDEVVCSAQGSPTQRYPVVNNQTRTHALCYRLAAQPSPHSRSWRLVPPQNPVDRTIVDVCALGVKLAYPDTSLAVRRARDPQIELEAATRARAREPRLAAAAGHRAPNDISPRNTSLS